jgi:hypothetical protein
MNNWFGPDRLENRLGKGWSRVKMHHHGTNGSGIEEKIVKIQTMTSMLEKEAQKFHLRCESQETPQGARIQLWDANGNPAVTVQCRPSPESGQSAFTLERTPSGQNPQVARWGTNSAYDLMDVWKMSVKQQAFAPSPKPALHAGPQDTMAIGALSVEPISLKATRRDPDAQSVSRVMSLLATRPSQSLSHHLKI